MENGDPASGQKMYIGSDPLPVYQYQNAGYVLLSARLFNIIKEIKISMAGEPRKTENPKDAGEGLSCIFSDGWEQ